MRRLGREFFAVSVTVFFALFLLGVTSCTNVSDVGDELAAEELEGDPVEADEEPGAEKPGEGARGNQTPIPDPGDRKDNADATQGQPGDDAGQTFSGVIEIISIDPTSGEATGGDSVTVIGNGFAANAEVFFGESEALNTLVIDDTTIVCDTPPRPPGIVDVMVNNPKPPNEPKEFAVLESAFVFFNPVNVESVDPGEGLIDGGLPVTVTGTGFAADSKVLFANKTAIDVNVVDGTTILAVTPIGASGQVDVHVTNSDGVGTLKDGFLYYAPPAIDAVDPTSGPIQGGNEVTIIGEGFLGTIIVRFGGEEAEVVQVANPSTATVIAPAGAEGAVDVEVETVYGFTMLYGGYTYVDLANTGFETVLLGVSPAIGPVTGAKDAYLTAYGLTDVEDTTVLFDGEIEADVISVDPASFTAHILTPAADDTGWVSVTLSNSNGSSTLDAGYLYEHAVTVDAVTPSVGPATGGTSITIVGSGFGSGAEVRVGALPALNVVVIDETTIEAVTPQGSAGFVPVKVKVDGVEGSLPDAFFYQTDGIELFLVEPDHGSIAGATFIQLVGSGFPGNAEVSLGGVAASHVTVVNSTLITAKTPPGDVGTVSVEVTSPQGNAILPDAFTFFNPAAALGGTWGGDVDGSVNVTVLDATNSSPIPDAFVMLYTDPTTPYQGFTNLQGQITFSGTDVLGMQMVSASKASYESGSVIEFDANNITIYLLPSPIPSSGPPPPGIGPPTVTGKLTGLDKYTIVPVGSCATKIAPPAPLCQVCETDADCGDGSFCVQHDPASPTLYCGTACGSSDDCAEGFTCGTASGEVVCLPSPGKKIAKCFSTKPHIFEDEIWHPMVLGVPGPNGEWEVFSEGDDYTVYAYPGETAVVCLGGYVEHDYVPTQYDPPFWEGFTPLTMGVARHVFTAPDEVTEDQDIELEFQMDRDVTVLFDNPPTNPPDFQGLFTYLDLGTDGVLEMEHALTTGFFGPPMLSKSNVREFTGLIYDSSFTFLGGAFTSMQTSTDNTPFSIVLARDVTSIEDDTIFGFSSGDWEGTASGIKQNINSLWGSSSNDIYGVGTGGTIAHYNGAGWTPQQSNVDQTLNDVYGFSGSNIVAVGDLGTAVHFNGIIWEPREVVGTSSQLNGVWGSAPDDVYAVGQYVVAHFDGQAWTTMSLGLSPKDYQDVTGAGADRIWIVGLGGWVYATDLETGAWTPKQLDHKKDLYSVCAFSAEDVFAVGGDGVISHFDGITWSDMESGTEESLRSVWGTGPSDVFAVGDKGTIIHYDGTAWTDDSPDDYPNALVAVWGAGEGHAIATGSHEFVLTPFLEVPIPNYPADGGVMTDYHIKFDVAEGYPASFHYMSITIPSMMGPIPIWKMITEGNVTEFDLPEFPVIEGTPGLPNGQLNFLLIRAYKPGFVIDNYDYTDFNTLDWRSWSVDIFSFTKQ